MPIASGWRGRDRWWRKCGGEGRWSRGEGGGRGERSVHKDDGSVGVGRLSSMETG